MENIKVCNLELLGANCVATWNESAGKEAKWKQAGARVITEDFI